MKVVHEEGEFKGKGGLKLYYQSWKPEQVRAVMVLAHGLAEYSGRYKHVAEHFASEGIAFYALDHRGHGLSEGDRGYVDRFDDYVEDLDTFIGIVKKKETGKKFVLLGHSMGGTIALMYALKSPNKIDYLILSSPALRLASEIDAGTLKMLEELAKTNPKQEIPSQIDPYTLSHDKKVCEAYANDPLIFKTITVRFVVEFVRAMNMILENADKLEVPTLLLVAGEDKLVNPKGSMELAEKAKKGKITMKVYNGMYHEILNEIEKKKVLEDIDQWLKTRI
ncbi:MAG: alpha/beta hydrolase [Candidatus Jordarchaeales archaeon]|nr:lysophospholipase [Candidatus Jordarchaeia archaeon]